jgi:hypothetical protein
MPMMKEHADKYFGKHPAPALVEMASAHKPAVKASVKLAKAKQIPVAAVVK